MKRKTSTKEVTKILTYIGVDVQVIKAYDTKGKLLWEETQFSGLPSSLIIKKIMTYEEAKKQYGFKENKVPEVSQMQS